MKLMRVVGIVFGLTLYCIGYCETFTIGVDQANPPLSMRTGSASHFIGFEAEIMNTICTRLQMTCVYQAVIVNQIIQALETGKIDFAINSIIIPRFALYGLVLSLPYLPGYAQFLTLKESRITQISDIPGKVIGVRLGAFQVNVDSDMYIKHLFKEESTVKEYSTISELLAALVDHEVDVVFADKYAINYWYLTNQSLYKFIGEPAYLGNGYGIMSLSKNQEIISAMNAVIKNMMNDGTYDKIYQRYFLSFA